MSVYRWFGTKEALVRDEFDPPILAEVERRLAYQPPLAAVRDALVSLLDQVYDHERDLVLDRARLIYREPALTEAAEHNGIALRDAFGSSLSPPGYPTLLGARWRRWRWHCWVPRSGSGSTMTRRGRSRN